MRIGMMILVASLAFEGFADMPMLTWLGRDKMTNDMKNVVLKILKEDESLSYGDKASENMLVHGDNLEALKSLLPFYAGRVKCIYIDPPYNTGNIFEHYDDNVEHSTWLNIMYPRLKLMREFLREDGCIWIQIDDDEQAYLKVICDEIFGRQNFVNMISVNMKNIAGASGGGEDKRIKKNCEYILVYAKNYASFKPFESVYEYREIYKVVEQYKDEGKTWHYTSVLVDRGEKKFVAETKDGDGNAIKIYSRPTARIRSITQVMNDERISEKDVYYKYGEWIFEAKDAQSSIRTRVRQAKEENEINDDIVSIEYVPKTGRNRGQVYEQFYKGDSCRLFAWLRDITETVDGVLYKKDKQGTYWNLTSEMNNLTKEGDVIFAKSKKPEALIARIIGMSTNPDDFVMDSFLGSGTTAAVAHKMGRKWIGIEMGEHAKTHCAVRLKKVVDGEQGGISRSVNWQCGGGFRFYELGEPILKEDGTLSENIPFDVMAAHVWFSETGRPYVRPAAKTTALGVDKGVAYALLYNGILHDRSVGGGNVLTKKTLSIIKEDLKEIEYEKLVVYGEATRLMESTLSAENIEFRQTPYDLVLGR